MNLVQNKNLFNVQYVLISVDKNYCQNLKKGKKNFNETS